MAGPYTGRGATLGFGVESTWGTAVSRTNWLRAASAEIMRTIDRQPVPHLGTLGGVPNRRSLYTAAIDVSGTFSHLMAYDDSTILLMSHALGSVSSSGTGPYTHECLLASDLLEGLTIEQIFGDDQDGNARAEVFEGCRIASAEISLTQSGIMMARYTVMGETSGGAAAAGSPTYSSNGEHILHAHAGQFSWNSQNYDLLGITIRWENALVRRQKLGSAASLQHLRGDFLGVFIDVDLEYENENFYTGMHAATQSDAAITLTGTGNNSLVITGHNAEVISESHTTASSGIIQQRATLRCLSDGTDDGLSLAFSNDNASAAAN